MNYTIKASVGLSALALSLAFGGTAFAQAADPDEGGDIIVTARKRDETAIATPVILTAVGGAELQKRAINSIDGIARLVPQLITGDSNGSVQGGTIALRGIGGADGNPFADQAVSFNVDGVAISRASVRKLASMDMQQVEVLKGPQALFFGKNSPGGIISIRTADPTQTYQGSLSVGREFVGREWRGEGYIAGPVTSTLGFRVAGYASKIGGWFTNIAPKNDPLASQNDREPKSKEYALRGTLLFEPTPDISMRLKMNYNHLNNDGSLSNSQLVSCLYGAPTFGAADNCVADNKITRGMIPLSFSQRNPIFGDGSTYLRTRQKLASLETNVNITDSLTLASVSGYYRVNTKWRDVFTIATMQNATNLGSVQKFGTREISQELRLQSSFDGPLNFMVGGYYQNGRTTNQATSLFNAITPTFLNNYRLLQTTKAYSFFGQAIWNILPTVELTGGGRYSDERKRLPTILAGSAASPGLSPVVTVKDRGHWTNFSPEATLSWRPTQDLTVFGSYKKGFLSGGFNASGNFTSDLTYDQQTIRGFEAGVKARLTPQLRVDLGAYTYRVAGLQVVTFNANGVALTSNAGKVSVKGVELNTNWRSPVEGLSLRGAINYNRGRYVEYLAPCYGGQSQALGCNAGTPRVVPVAGGGTKLVYSAQELSGTQIARAPEITGSTGFDYDGSLTADLKFGLSGSLTYTDGYFGDPASKPGGYQGNYALLDASVRVGAANGIWQVALIGKNLTDKYYFARSSDQTFSGFGTGDTVSRVTDTAAGINRGREVMLQLTVKFGG